jgi:hypothetical protein
VGLYADARWFIPLGVNVKVICAWCKKVLKESLADVGGGENEERVSHGICEECTKQYFGESQE